MKTRRDILKTGAAVVAVAAVPAAVVAETLYGGPAGGGMAYYGFDLGGQDMTVIAVARPTHHRFTFEVFVEGDIEAARKVHRVFQDWMEERDHLDLKGLRIGVNSSKVEPA